MTRNKYDIYPGLQADRFLDRTSVGDHRPKQITEVGDVIESLYIGKPVRKLTRSGISQFGCRRIALLADFPKSGSVKGELQSAT